MKFAEMPPSEQWSILNYKGVKLAEVWFKPEDQPHSLLIRIPRESFHISGVGGRLTPENLLRSLVIAADEVDCWSDGRTDYAGLDAFQMPLAEPAPEVDHLAIHVLMKHEPESVPLPESEAVPQAMHQEETPAVTSEPPSTKWQDLKARWGAILGVEATVDNLRVAVEGLQTSMQSALKKTLSTEEKLHALHADIAQWTKAKSRVHHTLPKVREYVHRATWAAGLPERKKLEALFKEDTQPDLSHAALVKLADDLENLLKDRQVLAGQGTSVCQECKNVASGIDTALRNLQNHAAMRAESKRRAAAPKGKFFKSVRKWSGVD